MSFDVVKKHPLPFIAVCIIVASTLIGGRYGSSRMSYVTPASSSYSDELADGFDEALTEIQESYAGKTDLEILGKYSIQGMLHQLDPHSTFFTKAEFDDVQTEQSSRTFGIGVTIAKRYDHVYILSATPGGPSQRAGLRYGDAIIAVDKQNVEDWSTEQIMHRVRGEKGEPVEITVERAGWPAPITVTLKRDEVKLASVRNAFMVGQGGIGYIALTGGFSSKTDEELTEAMALLKQEGARQLVLDLRDNPGGLLDEAIKVAKKFLPPGEKIVEVRGRDSESSLHTYRVPDNNVPETMPMVILMNRRTASASEVVAGALQDHDRALIVGENSFGKGLVQGVFHLWGGTGLVLTTAKYYTPTGRSIQRDYSSISFYDYYLNRSEAEASAPVTPRGDALRTDLGRAVYGGGGITPDVEVKSPETGAVRGRLFYSVFDFTRQLVAGQVAGMREYRIGETQYKAKLTAEDINRYPITDELVAAFRSHISAKPAFNVTENQFNSQLDYIRTQLRREIISAAYGPEAGDQVYLSDDVQFRKAVESLDQARMLADNARRARADRQQ
ncbi:MAG TPA: S41 family peptidase [Blastocatellia bacterium]|nr:S41 family peptidase [Blastocatellia bacterium]